jgi:TRAP-type C4-dicarboxylate transport system permease small subunit
MLDLFDRAVARASWLGACIASFAIFASTVLIIGAIAARALFGISAFWVAEVGGYLMATATFCALAYALRQGVHIRATLLLDQLGPRARVATESICAALCCGAISVGAWYMWLAVRRHYLRGTVSDTGSGIQLYIPMAVVFVALVLLALELLLCTLRPSQSLHRHATVQIHQAD